MSVMQEAQAEHPAGDLGAIVDRYRPDLRTFENAYRGLHQLPDLPSQEESTSSFIAEYLAQLRFEEVPENIGGHGVVGIVRNGTGKTVLIRAELDALPVQERTRLPYASKEWMEDSWGVERPVMHACAHDMHMTCVLAASALLLAAKEHWSDTLLVLFQPNEVWLGGAQAMLDDGLYDRVPVPDIILAQHVMPLKSGTLALSPGPILAAADTIDIRINSTGPGVNPQDNIDPTLVAAKALLRMHSEVIDPNEKMSLTCEQFHSGWPGADYRSYSDMSIDLKTYDPGVRDKALAAITKIVEDECSASGIKDKPTIEHSVRAPLTSSTPSFVQQISKTFNAHLQGEFVEQKPSMSCEDFSLLATAKNLPYVYWFLGGTDPEVWKKAQESDTPEAVLPNNHSPYFAPVVQPTMRVGTDAMALAVLTFLGEGA